MAEGGLAGFDVAQWYGVVVPAGTPGDIATKLHADIVDLLKLSDIRTRMADFGADPVGSTPAQFSDLIRSEITKYQKIVKATKITLN